jgi:hypothetical protein
VAGRMATTTDSFRARRPTPSGTWLNTRKVPEAPTVAAPIEGLVFDVEHNGLWLTGWGSRPARMPDPIRQARDALAGVARLVPVWGHRYLPTEPHYAGNPVLSVVQTDIVVYGRDLADYFSREFHTVPLAEQTASGPPPEIPFWGQFLG